MSELYKFSIKDKLKGLLERKFSSIEITASYIERIKNFDSNLNSYITLTEDLAIKKAKDKILK